MEKTIPRGVRWIGVLYITAGILCFVGMIGFLGAGAEYLNSQKTFLACLVLSSVLLYFIGNKLLQLRKLALISVFAIATLSIFTVCGILIAFLLGNINIYENIRFWFLVLMFLGVLPIIIIVYLCRPKVREQFK